MSRKQRPHLHVVLSTTSTFNVSKIIQQHLIVFSVTLFSARFEMCNNSRYRQHQELLLIPPPKKTKKQKKTSKRPKASILKEELANYFTSLVQGLKMRYPGLLDASK